MKTSDCIGGFAFLLAFSSMGAPGSAQTSPLTKQAECGTFLELVCFSSLNSQRLSYPAGFSIDEVELPNGAHVTIYEGIGLAEQPDVAGITKSKAYSTPTVRIDIFTGISSRGKYFDIHLEQIGQHWGVVQVFGYVRNRVDATAVAQFISGMHVCKSSSLAITCSNDWPLDEASEFVGALAQ